MGPSFTFAAESKPGAWIGLWSCLDIVRQSGYRLRAESTEAGWTFFIERCNEGGFTTIGVGHSGPLEGPHLLKLDKQGSELSAILDGVPIAAAIDGNFHTGYSALEGNEGFTFGETYFRQDATLLDSFTREENPLAKGWTVLPWTGGPGECFSETFGWVPTGGLSGAYWNATTFTEPELSEGEGGGRGQRPTVTAKRGGVVPARKIVGRRLPGITIGS